MPAPSISGPTIAAPEVVTREPTPEELAKLVPKPTPKEPPPPKPGEPVEPVSLVPKPPLEETHQKPGAGDMWISKPDYGRLSPDMKGVYDEGGWEALEPAIIKEAEEKVAERHRTKPAKGTDRWKALVAAVGIRHKGWEEIKLPSHADLLKLSTEDIWKAVMLKRKGPPHGEPNGTITQTFHIIQRGKPTRTGTRTLKLDKWGYIIPVILKKKTGLGKKHIEGAQAAREAERKAGETVHSIAYHLKQASIARAKPPVTPELPTKIIEEAREIVVRGRKVTLPAGRVYDLDKIAADPELAKTFIAEVKGGKGILLEHYKLTRTHTQTATGEWYLKTDLAELKKSNPELYNTLIKKGTTAYEVEAKSLKVKIGAEAFEYQQFLRSNTKLPDGKWISNTELARAKKDDPIVHRLLTTHGFAAADAYIDQQEIIYKRQLAEYERYQAFSKQVAPYTDKEGRIDVAAAITAGVGDRPLAFLLGEKELAEVKEEIAKQPEAVPLRQMGMELIPFYGRYLEYERVKKDGLTTSEIAWLVGNSVLDLLIVLPLVGGVSAGARAAAGLGRIATLKGVGKGIGRVALAEIKAPYTIIRHPISTAKTMVAPLKVILKRSRIPTAAAELRSTTIRLPVKAIGSEAEAMKLRDIATLKAIKGEKAVATVGGTKVKLEKVAIQKLGEPIAIHSTPDIRPFLEGAVVKSGREGGLFVSPSLHTRFSHASAFGQIPKGGIKGGVVIKDPKLLKYLSPSGKIFKPLKGPKVAEVEAMFKAGMELPPPGQLLTMSDIAGDTLTLAVIGKPFTAAQLAKLKFMGTLDTVGVIFGKAGKLTKEGRAIASSYDELIELRQVATQLTGKARKLRRQGKIAEAVAMEAEASRSVRAATRYAELAGTRMAATTTLRVAMSSYLRNGVLERWQRITDPRQRGRAAKRGVTRLGDSIISERALARIPTDKLLRRPARPPRVPRLLGVPKRPPKVPVRPPRVPRVPRVPVKPPIPPRVPIKPPIPPKPPLRPPVPPKPPRVPPVPPKPPMPPPPPRIPRPRPMPDKEKRKRILKSKGAFTFRMGELGRERDVWYTYVSPYNKPEHRIVVVGKAPEGALIVRGPGSAIKTAQVLRGKAITEKRTDDIGFMDAIFEPILKRKGIRLSFNPDPRGLTVGDFGTPFRISKAEPISPRVGSITERRASLSRGRGIRITPKVGKLK